MERVGEGGRYRLGELLGRGGMGEVYRATDEVLGREVAVKLMLPAPQSLAVSQRFLREAQASARIRSRHVVAAYDFGAYGAGYYLAMELVSGHSVADELERNGLFPAERAEQVVRQAAAGLAAAHTRGIVHRDIKASNLLLADDGTVKVADFGIVRFLHETTTTLTMTGQIIGTSYFLSPERARGEPAEPPSDVYALGCVLYQLVTGRPPFTGESPAAIMYQHVQNEPAPPSEFQPGLDGELEALILWMLAKDPVRRPTAAQIVAGERPPTHQTTSLLPVRRTRSRPVVAAIAAGIALVLSATIGIILETRGVQLPATNDLQPVTTPGTPTAPPPTRPSPTTTSSRPTTEQEHSGPGKAKAAPKQKAGPKAGPGSAGTKATAKGAKKAKQGAAKPKKSGDAGN
ncbi:serine/threonine-protein kinase [Kribbella sp. NPDC050124]|uniref:serine/threonine-protein kinase n=1 Tax=Kribbella sp. NPDC050124 TaxID=3364114 RepID=UPI0037BB27A2